MKTKKIIEALTRWSPNGLCADELVAQGGGRPESTVGCAVGCLALEFLHSPEGKEFVGSQGLEKALYKVKMNTYIDSKLEGKVREFYGLGPRDLDTVIMGFNDEILTCDGTVDQFRLKSRDLPRDLKRTILKLRKQHERFQGKV